MKLLIVDDREENLLAARKGLGSKYYDLVCARNLEEAIEEIKRGEVFAVVSDLMFPERFGKEPEEMGWRLISIAQEAGIKVLAVITSGVDHHQNRSAFYWTSFTDENLKEVTNAPKTEPRAWDIVFREALGMAELFGGIVGDSLDCYAEYAGKDPVKTLLSIILQSS